MTVTSETNKAQATGNGVVTVFFYTFQVPEAEWLEVYLDDVLQSTGFVVAGIGDPTGGSVTFTVAPAVGVIVTLLRVVPLTQEVDYQPFDPFPAEVAEGTLDKLTMITQQLQEEINRAWRVPIDTPPGVTIAPPPFSPGDVLGWSETEQNTLVNYPGIGTFTGLVDDAEAAASGAATSEANALAYANSAQGSATSAANSSNSAANSAAAAQVAKLEWQGAWSAAANYEANDVVESAGSSYVALVANTNVTPVVGATWDLVALKGAKGDPGQSGTGTGDVNGPAVSTLNAIALYNSTDGTVIKDGPLITTSATDTTAGRVTKVGDFGLGDSTGSTPVVADANAVPAVGAWRLTTPFANGPTAAAHTIIQNTYGASNQQQIAIATATGKVYVRVQTASVWGAWLEVWTTGNLVKTTSATDVTAGSMLKVGDFGFNGPSIAADANADLNGQPFTKTDANARFFGFSWVNMPAGLAGIIAVVEWQSYSVDWGRQLFVDIYNNKSYERYWFSGTTWSPWREVATSGSTPSFINVKDKFTDKGSIASAVTINPLVDGGDVKFTMTGNTAVTFTTSGIASGESAVCSVQVLGAFAVTWPAGIFWPGGAVPAYAANSIYTFQFRNNAGTMQIFGFQSGKGMAVV